MEAPLRDLFGLEVPPDHSELFATYTPLWLSAERARRTAWAELLVDAARAAGLPSDAVTRLPEDARPGSPELRPFEAAMEAVLQDTSSLPPSSRQQLRSRFCSLAAGCGIPAVLRPVAWPLLLHARERMPLKRYAALLQLQGAPPYCALHQSTQAAAAAAAKVIHLMSWLQCASQSYILQPLLPHCVPPTRLYCDSVLQTL
jgi:hypothetical protein